MPVHDAFLPLGESSGVCGVGEHLGCGAIDLDGRNDRCHRTSPVTIAV